MNTSSSLISTTIAAIATAQGRGGIGVVRISGHHLAPLVVEMCRKEVAPRQAVRANFYAADGAVIDHGLILYFVAPHSFTGEDVIELQGHGGMVVLQMLLARTLELGARIAQPGEFTQRAFLNGKLDLAQAEAVADLIDAASTRAAQSAMRSLQGDFSKTINIFLAELIEVRMQVEASLDFPEEDIDVLGNAQIVKRLVRLQSQIQTVFERAQQGRLLQGGMHVVLAGLPNVGKSSLLNQLAGDDLAIVTPIAGTTRDAVRSNLQIEGVPLHIIDTAGLRETDDAVEKIGIARSWQEIERADLIVLLLDARSGLNAESAAILARLPQQLPHLIVFNKIDLVPMPAHSAEVGSETHLWLSAKAGEGIDLLRQALLRIIGWHPAEDVFIARERHLQALSATRSHLANALLAQDTVELLAEELRLAQQTLATITGQFSADDLLGEIFSRFCIGK